MSTTENTDYWTFTKDGTSYVYVPELMELYRCPEDQVEDFVGSELEDADPVTLDRDIEPTRIMELYLILTSDCNLSCSYCYEKECGFLRQQGKMDRDMIDEIFEALESGPVTLSDPAKVTLFGGEPTVEDDLIPYVTERLEQFESDNDVELRRGIVTNGFEVSDEVLDHLEEHEYNVGISMDGPPQVHNANRRTLGDDDTYEGVRDTAERVLSRDCVTQFETTVTPETLGDYTLVEIVEHMRDLGFDQGTVIYDVYGRDFRDEDIEMIREMVQYSLNTLLTDDPFMLDRVESLYTALVNRRPKRTCIASRGTLAIDPNGIAYPCQPFVEQPEYVVDTLDEDGFDAESFEEYGEHFSDNKRLDHPVCQECWARNSCLSRCYFANYADGDDIGEFPGSQCRSHQATNEELLKFLADVLEDPEKKEAVTQSFSKLMQARQ